MKYRRSPANSLSMAHQIQSPQKTIEPHQYSKKPVHHIEDINLEQVLTQYIKMNFPKPNTKHRNELPIQYIKMNFQVLTQTLHGLPLFAGDLSLLCWVCGVVPWFDEEGCEGGGCEPTLGTDV